jgi:hypothetical protein
MVTLLNRNLNRYEQTILDEYFKKRRGIQIPHHLVQGGRADRLYEIRSIDKFFSYEKDTHSILIESYTGSGTREELVMAEWGAQSTNNRFEVIEQAVAEKVTSVVRYDVDDTASVMGILGGGIVMLTWLFLLASAFPGWKEVAASASTGLFIGTTLIIMALSAVVLFGGLTLIRRLFNSFALSKRLSQHPILQLIRTRSHTNAMGLESGMSL